MPGGIFVLGSTSVEGITRIGGRGNPTSDPKSPTNRTFVSKTQEEKGKFSGYSVWKRSGHRDGDVFATVLFQPERFFLLNQPQCVTFHKKRRSFLKEEILL